MSTQDEANKIVSESGNSFHCRVASHFRSKKDWKVMLCPYYLDNATDKARELDLICEREIAWQGYRTGDAQALRIQLYIECKYIKQATVFWFDRQDELAANSWLDKNTPFKMSNSSQHHHHYLRSMDLGVAKLFSSGPRAQTDESDPIYKAIAQSLGGLIHFRDVNSPFPPKYGHLRTTTLRYPVVIHCGGSHFFRTGVDSVGPVDPLEANFLLEVNYAYVRPNSKSALEYFLIDIVDFGKLDAFLDLLDQEARHAMQILDRD